MTDNHHHDNNNDKPSSFFTIRRLYLNLMAVERRYMAKIRKTTWLAQFLHSDLFSLQALPVCRGLAIGLFWAFIPMPLQMIPATLFCLIGFANLPIAIIVIWVSNPLTYLPIFYTEYMIGYYLFATPDAVEMTFAEFSKIVNISELGHMVSNIFWLIAKGGLVLASVLAVVGYGIGFPLSRYLLRHVTKIKRKKA